MIITIQKKGLTKTMTAPEFNIGDLVSSHFCLTDAVCFPGVAEVVGSYQFIYMNYIRSVL